MILRNGGVHGAHEQRGDVLVVLIRIQYQHLRIQFRPPHAHDGGDGGMDRLSLHDGEHDEGLRDVLHELHGGHGGDRHDGCGEEEDRGEQLHGELPRGVRHDVRDVDVQYG